MKTSLSLCLVMLTAACTVTPSVKQAKETADKTSQQASALLNTPAAIPKETEKATKNKGIWLGARIIVDSNQRITSPWLQNRNVVLKESYSSLNDVITALSRDANIPTRLTAEPIPRSNQGITLSHDGFIGDALDSIANHYNLFWTEDNGTIIFSITQTKAFQVHGVGGNVSNRVSVNGDQANGGGQGGGTTAEQRASFDATDLSAFNSIADAVRTMISPSGKVVLAAGSGSVIVTDMPDRLDRISAYIDQQNQLLSKQVAIEFRVFTVSKNTSDSYGFDWNAMFKALSNKYNLTINAPSNLSSLASSFAITIPANASGGAGEYAGSQLIARAMSEFSTVTQITSATLRTLNNKPTQYRRGNTLTYISKNSAQAVANVGVTSSAEIAKERLGFSLNVLPNVLADGQIVMQTTISLKTLNRLRTIQQGAGTSQTVIEAPQTDENELGTQAILRSGETLVLAGFEQDNSNSTQNGVGSAQNFLFGGESGKNSKDLVVFTLTPVIVQSR